MSQKRVSVHALSATVVATLLAVGSTAGLPSPAQAAAGTTYFISAAGSDSNSGTSSSTPWKSLAKINATVLKPGDTVSFRRGDTWTGGVVTGQSGSAAAPITVNGYGSGSAPTVTG